MAPTSMLVEEDTRRSRLTLPMVVLTLFSAIGGFLFGYDTGVVSGAMLLVRKDFQLSNIWHELIVSGTLLAAWFTAMFSGTLTDRVGRRSVIILASCFFTIGSVVIGVAPGKITMLVGRVVVGVAIGLSSMVIPVYLSEVAESSVRGRITVTNVLFITAGQFTASLVCGIFSGAEGGWRVMFGIAAVPALIQLVGFLFLPESPRWLVEKDRRVEANLVLVKFRSPGDNIEEELQQIIEARDKEKCVVTFKRIYNNDVTRKALVIGCLLQMFQQLSGINTVMYYSASIITMAGIADTQTAIWLSVVVSSFNFFFSFVGLWLVERMGRRPLLLWSLLGVTISLLVLAVSFHVSHTNSPLVNFPQPGQCSHFTSCSYCVSASECGFCFLETNSSYFNSTCLPSNSSHFNTISSSGQCSSPSSSFSFAYDWCPSPNAWVAVLGLVLYLATFAPGMGPMPWTINSEIFPSWSRAQCVGVTTSVNWFFNLLVSITFLTLTETLTKHGTFYLYTCLSTIGLVIFYQHLPETRGRTLEQMSLIFNTKNGR